MQDNFLKVVKGGPQDRGVIPSLESVYFVETLRLAGLTDPIKKPPAVYVASQQLQQEIDAQRHFEAALQVVVQRYAYLRRTGFDQYAAASARVHALLSIIADGALTDFVTEQEETVTLDPRVFEAAAFVPVNQFGRFQPEQFIEAVYEIADPSPDAA